PYHHGSVLWPRGGLLCLVPALVVSKTRSPAPLRRSKIISFSKARDFFASGNSGPRQSVNLTHSSSRDSGRWWLPLANSTGPLFNVSPSLVVISTASAGAKAELSIVAAVVVIDKRGR